MKSCTALVVLCVLVISCSPLRKSQSYLIADYFSTVAEYPTYIRKLNQDVAELSIDWGNLNSALKPSDSLRVEGLVSAINEYEGKLSFPDTVRTSMQFLENYVSGYYLLVPNGFDLYRTVKSTSESIVGLFGLRSVVSSVLPDGNDRTRPSNRKKVYEHFYNNKEQLHVCLTNIKSFVDEDLMQAIAHADHQLRIDFRRLFTEDAKQVSSIDHYFNYNQHFIETFQQIILTRKLAVRLSNSLGRLLLAEEEVAVMTAEPKKIEKNSKLLNELTNDLKLIQGLVESKEFSK